MTNAEAAAYFATLPRQEPAQILVINDGTCGFSAEFLQFTTPAHINSIVNKHEDAQHPYEYLSLEDQTRPHVLLDW